MSLESAAAEFHAENDRETNFASGIWQEPERVLVSTEILPLLLQDVSNRHDAYCSAQSILDTLLEDAQSQYLTFPQQTPARESEVVTLHVTFKRPSPVEEATTSISEDGEEIVTEAQRPPDKSTTLQFTIGRLDTAQSMERTVLNEIARLKASVVDETNTENNIGTAPSESAVLVSQFLSSGWSPAMQPC
eukprot:gene21754-27809_t